MASLGSAQPSLVEEAEMVAERDLTPDERNLLLRILESAQFAGAHELKAQVPVARVAGGSPTFLDLKVAGSATVSSYPDGPIPVRALVEGPNGSIVGEVLVWTKGGYLSGLEQAWFTDEAPRAMPSPDHIRVPAG